MKSSSSQHSSSSSSHSPNSSSTRAQRRGIRTTNACAACKKRKTKCSGPPGACGACRKVDTFCHFNLRLDTRRKLAYKPNAVGERQQYILQAVLHTLKSGDSNEVTKLISLLRNEAPPEAIAGCLRSNIHSLQDRGIIPDREVDETDLISLGLQGLFSHRAGRPGVKRSLSKPSNGIKSPISSTESSSLESDHANNKDLPMSSFASPRHGPRLQGDQHFSSHFDDNNLMHYSLPLDCISLPSEDFGRSSHGASLPYDADMPVARMQDTTNLHLDPQATMLYHAHNFQKPQFCKAYDSHNAAAQSISPYSTFKFPSGSGNFIDFQNSQSAQVEDSFFMGCLDTQAGTTPSFFRQSRLNEVKRAECSTSRGQRLPQHAWEFTS